MKNHELRSTYQRDGMVPEVDVLSWQEAKAARQNLQDFISQHRDVPSYADWTYFKSHLVLKWVAELAAHPALLDHMEALIGPDILLWNSFIPAKPPKSSGHFGWHQDATYWPISPVNRVVTFWLALCNVSPTNGGMRMVPGSHRQGQLPHLQTADASSMLRRSQQVDLDVDESNAIEIRLASGQASVHHPLTLHGSGGNASNDWRLGIGFNYAAGDVSTVKGYRDSALLLRGNSGASNFNRETIPDADLSPSSLERYQAAVGFAGTRYTNSPTVQDATPVS